MARIFDIIFFIYFLIHIPVALFFHSPSVIPSKFFPKQLIDLRNWYSNTYRDVLLRDSPVWMQSYICSELILLVPFFFVALYGYLKGAENNKWLRIPAIIYGSHAATVISTSMAYVLFEDFSHSKYPAPRNMEERLTLVAFYSPFFIIPLMLLFDAAFSSAYTSGAASAKSKKNAQSQNTPKNVPKPQKKALIAPKSPQNVQKNAPKSRTLKKKTN